MILYCLNMLKGADEASHLPPSGNLRDHHNILQYVCDGIATMKTRFLGLVKMMFSDPLWWP